MDRAVRNARVLIRRAAVSLQTGEPAPNQYADLVWQLADATAAISHQIGTGIADDTIGPLIEQLAVASAEPAPGVELSAEVIRAQVRSILVDYLMVLGLDYEAAQRRVVGAGEYF